MGLLDSLLEGVVGAGQAKGGTNGGGALLQLASELVRQQPGGVQGLVDQLARAGLGREAQSWVGTGNNLSVSAAQIAKALGAGAGGKSLSDLLSPLGMSQNDALGGLAKVLPELVNQLTPKGRVESDGNLEQTLGAVLEKFL